MSLNCLGNKDQDQCSVSAQFAGAELAGAELSLIVDFICGTAGLKLVYKKMPKN